MTNNSKRSPAGAFPCTAYCTLPTLTVKLQTWGLCNPALFFLKSWPTCLARPCPGPELCGYVGHFSAHMWQKKASCHFLKEKTRIIAEITNVVRVLFSPWPLTWGHVCPSFCWNGLTGTDFSVHSPLCCMSDFIINFIINSSAFYWLHFQSLSRHKQSRLSINGFELLLFELMRYLLVFLFFICHL